MPGPAGLEQEPPGGGCGLEAAWRALVRVRRASSASVAGLVAAGEFDAGAGDQGEEEFEDGDVEGEGGDGQERVVGVESEAGLRMAWRKLARARWGTMTPLGRPVEPEV